MEIIFSKQSFKKLKNINISDKKYAVLIKNKLLLIKEKKINLYQLKWYKWFYKERVWKYRIIFTYSKECVNIILLEKRDLVYSILNHLL